MTTDIFIRTYSKDLQWLQYCLKSIHKYVRGYRQIIICIPANEQHLLKPWNLTQEKVVGGIVGQNGYLLQQIDKLLAYKHTDADTVIFIDSDCCYKEPCDIGEYFRDGKPIIYETPWELVGPAQCWRGPTEKILGFETETEKMRRLPFTFRTDTLKRFDEKFKTMSLVSHPDMSEFNLMGSFAKGYEAQNYYFWNTETETPPPSRLKQFWSWSGLKPEERKEMEGMLR